MSSTPRPESGRDCHMCAVFARPRQRKRIGALSPRTTTTHLHHTFIISRSIAAPQVTSPSSSMRHCDQTPSPVKKVHDWPTFVQNRSRGYEPLARLVTHEGLVIYGVARNSTHRSDQPPSPIKKVHSWPTTGYPGWTTAL